MIVVRINAFIPPLFCCREPCTNPLQKNSSAGPIMNNSKAAIVQSGSEVFILYMPSTCGRANEKSILEHLSPSQNTPHNKAAKIIPSINCLKVSAFMVFLNKEEFPKNAMISKVSPEKLIVIQKFVIPAVQGENI